MNQAVEMADLRFSYPSYGRNPATLFSSLFLTVEKGEFRCICGEPGSGKSTLAHILAGLIPKYSGGEFSGKFQLLGKDVSREGKHDMLTLLGLVMQDADQQIVTTSCEDEIAFPLESLGMAREEIGRRIDHALSFFGLCLYREREPAELSGGEKKKLMLAVAEALDPPILVLDEALEEIDESFKRTYLERLLEKGKTIIYFAAKTDGMILSLAHRWSVLEDGVLHSANSEEIRQRFSRPALEIGAFAQKGRSALRIKNLQFSYQRGFSLAIESLELNTGEITVLVGPNGSGKSTLCRAISGLIRPHTGGIELSNGSFWEPADDRRCSKWSAYMFQNPDYQIFLPTIEDEISFGLKRVRMPADKRRETVDDAIQRFDLPADSSIPPSILSYGERKLLQAAVYYVLEKGIYIFDELDSALSFRIIEHILSSFCTKDVVILIVTHHMEFARSIAHRLITMEQGRVLSDQRFQRDG